MTKQEHYESLMDRAEREFGQIYEDEDQALNAVELFSDALNELSEEQLKVLDNKDLAWGGQIMHDVFGIARKERHFLPRIKELQAVTEYIS